MVVAPVKPRTPLFLPFLFFALACTSSTLPARTSPVDDQIRALLPGLTIDFEDAVGQESDEHGVRRFSYSSAPKNDWPYGTGFAIWSTAGGQVLWVYLHNGDFPLHPVHWADFDGDSRLDLFFHAGFEDVFTTHLYLNRVSSSQFGVSQFAQAYENDEVYASVTDLDGNGQPELLVPEPYLAEDDKCADAFRGYAIASPLWQDEYSRIAGKFSSFNFIFGTSPQEADSLALFSRVRFVSFGRRPGRKAVQEHLKLRSSILARAADVLPHPCRARAVEVAEHVAELLAE